MKPLVCMIDDFVYEKLYAVINTTWEIKEHYPQFELGVEDLNEIKIIYAEKNLEKEVRMIVDFLNADIDTWDEPAIALEKDLIEGNFENPTWKEYL